MSAESWNGNGESDIVCESRIEGGGEGLLYQEVGEHSVTPVRLGSGVNDGGRRGGKARRTFTSSSSISIPLLTAISGLYYIETGGMK